ncbi:MAG: UDP-3-O-(3-hydroxymyristoyl)glucosamine N-acyltransferase [Pseudomonadota bacterium]|nr:UDP-3-O-(3-hydroxymyristoyl)glucosamine N-acyltransferase [Pseudomonadota bacterium]
MADARFFDRAGPFSLMELAKTAGTETGGATLPTQEYSDVMPLARAGANHVSFIDNRRYIKHFRSSGAGAIIVAAELVPLAPPSAALLIADDPYRSYARIAQLYYPKPPTPGSPRPGLPVAESAKVGNNVVLMEGSVIGENCIIGDNCSIGEHTVLGQGVHLGEGCRIAPGCTLICCTLGSNVIVHPGARIGQDGFGFAPGTPSHEKVPQLGAVVIEDNVEVGANTCIDRGAGPDTIVGAGTKIDNLCQIAHNVEIGSGCLIASQVGISGSSKLGNLVMVGGQTGIAGHLVIGDHAIIAGKSGVTKDVPAGMTVAGFPAIKSIEHWRNQAVINKLRKDRQGLLDE